MPDIEIAIALLAEAKIQEAMKDGAFDNLPGKGQPVHLEDLTGVPPELRMGYTLLKNAGYLPMELELYEEITSLQRLVDCCTDKDQKKSLKTRLYDRKLRYDMMTEKKQRRIPRVGGL